MAAGTKSIGQRDGTGSRSGLSQVLPQPGRTESQGDMVSMETRMKSQWEPSENTAHRRASGPVGLSRDLQRVIGLRAEEGRQSWKSVTERPSDRMNPRKPTPRHIEVEPVSTQGRSSESSESARHLQGGVQKTGLSPAPVSGSSVLGGACGGYRKFSDGEQLGLSPAGMA